MNPSNKENPKKKNPWYLKADAPPYVPKPKGTPWHAIEPVATVLVVIFPLWFFIVHGVGYLNSNPDPSDLIYVDARIVNTYRLTPHLLVRMSDGSLKSMEFPVLMGLRGAECHMTDGAKKKRQKNS